MAKKMHKLLTKKCCSCKEVKSVHDFPFRYKERNKVGYQSICKRCKNIAKQIRRKTSLRSYISQKIKNLAKIAKVKYGISTTSEQVTAIKQMLYDKSQSDDFKCPYTGERLRFKVNMHLDHKIPISKDPAKIIDINNLQWTSAVYNHAKWDMTDEEFNSKYILRYRSPNKIQKQKRGPIRFKKRLLFFLGSPLTTQQN